jgi:hypothetical protein
MCHKCESPERTPGFHVYYIGRVKLFRLTISYNSNVLKEKRLSMFVITVLVATIIVMVAVIVVVVAVPAAGVVSPATIVVVPVVMGVVGVWIRGTIPTAADPAVVIALRSPIATDPVGALVWRWAGVFVTEGWGRGSNVDANLSAGGDGETRKQNCAEQKRNLLHFLFPFHKL